MEKKCKVVMLPTGNKSNIFKQTYSLMYGDPIYNSKLECSFNQTYIDNIHLISSGKAATNSKEKYQFYNLYITSDDEIKESDWFIANQGVHQCIEIDKENTQYPYITKNNKGEIVNHSRHWNTKIIATTDKSLIIGKEHDDTVPYLKMRNIYLPQIPQSFIQKYCELGGINEVMVELKSSDLDFFWEDLKVNSHNEIIIHQIKDNWSREEVDAIVEEKMRLSYIVGQSKDKFEHYQIREDWIQENLN